MFFSDVFVIFRRQGKRWRGGGGRGMRADWVAWKTIATVESSMELPRKIKNETSLWYSDSTSGNISKETWDINVTEFMHPYVHRRVIYNSQDLEAAQMPISGWVGKKAMVHLHSRIWFGHWKERSLTFATAWMDLESILLSKISRSEKDTDHMISITCILLCIVCAHFSVCIIHAIIIRIITLMVCNNYTHI